MSRYGKGKEGEETENNKVTENVCENRCKLDKNVSGVCDVADNRKR